MIALIQRVDSAKVSAINSDESSHINKGILILLGVRFDDSSKDIDYLIKKLNSLKLFASKEHYFSASIKEAQAEIMVVSQFTLYAELNRGSKPSFTKAMEPIKAKFLYQQFCDRLIKEGFKIKTGIFGAHMKVELINDGPVTFNLCSDHLKS